MLETMRGEKDELAEKNNELKRSLEMAETQLRDMDIECQRCVCLIMYDCVYRSKEYVLYVPPPPPPPLPPILPRPQAASDCNGAARYKSESAHTRWEWHGSVSSELRGNAGQEEIQTICGFTSNITSTHMHVDVAVTGRKRTLA